MVSLYNSGDWISNRLQNLLQSDCRDDMEVWCVNADSPDQRDHDIPQQFPVRYVRLPARVNVYAAWNHIIQNSDSRFITNANSDDLIAPNGYSMLMNNLDAHGDGYGFAYPSWYCTDIPNQQWNSLRNIDQEGRPGDYHGNLDSGGVGHFPLWRRSLHERAGLFDDKFQALADADWWARCYFILGTKFIWINHWLAAYLWRNGDNLWHRAINADEWDRYHHKVEQYRLGKLE